MKHYKNPTIGMDQILDTEFETWHAPSDGRFAAPDDEDTSLNISAQQRLWLAVIQMTVKDATGPDAPDDEMEEFHRRTARAVIFSRNSVTAGYFNEVCNLAGVDPNVIRLRVTKMIREGIHIDDIEE